MVEAQTALNPEEESLGAAARPMAAQREAYSSEHSGDPLAGQSRRREALEREEGGSRAKLDLGRRLQGGLISGACVREALLAEEAERREAVRGWDRAAVKEGFRRREIKKAERGAWKKLLGSCSGSEDGGHGGGR